MPVTTLSSDPGRASKNSLHRKNNSGELDVFEAARYFSTANDTHHHRPGPFENRLRPPHRLSLDMPINIALQETPKENTNKKSHKQPSSPGSKLISTLMNSIFNQSGSKKKNKSSKSGHEKVVGPGEARKRRSSMGAHFGSVTLNNINHHHSKLPDSCAKTPTKSSYKELLFRRFPVSRPGNSVVSPGLTCQLDDKSRPPGNVINNYPTIWADDDDEDDGESDSSSDLFDLPIISNELDLLPVYGTTHMERIAPVVV